MRGPFKLTARLRLPLLAALICVVDVPAHAQRIDNVVAVFAALDKVTAAVSKVTVQLNQTGEFRTLRITPRACYTRAPTEPPRTSTFVEIDEIMFDGKEKRIFTGWMFAESPGLNPLLHPVFDVWLTSCQQPRSAPSAKGPQTGPAPDVWLTSCQQPRSAPSAKGPQTGPAPDVKPPEDDLPRRRRVPR